MIFPVLEESRSRDIVMLVAKITSLAACHRGVCHLSVRKQALRFDFSPHLLQTSDLADRTKRLAAGDIHSDRCRIAATCGYC